MDADDETPVFITIGQSNADGTAPCDATEDARLRSWYVSSSNPRKMKMWYHSCYLDFSKKCWVFDGTGNQVDHQPGWLNLWYRNENFNGRTAMQMLGDSGTWSQNAQNRRGMEGQFGMKFQTAFPEKELYVIKLGAGGSAISTWTSDDNHNWEFFYNNFYLPAMNDLLAKGKKPRLAGVWWMQGCSDQYNSREYYRSRLTELITKIRTATGFENAPVYIGYIVKPGENPAYPNASTCYAQNVRDAQNDVTTPGSANYIPGTYIINGKDQPFASDNLHWNHVGVNGIGDLISERVIAAGPEGWASFSTPGHWEGFDIDRPVFVPDFGTPAISYTTDGPNITATLDYGTWTETKTTRFIPDNAIYVKPAGNGDGSSWDNALGNLPDAITLAKQNNISKIYLANGTYQLTSPLEISAGISVIGGYEGDGDATVITNAGDGDILKLYGTDSNPATVANVTLTGATTGRGATITQYGKIYNCIIENNDSGVIPGETSSATKKKNRSGAGVLLGEGSIVGNCIIRNNTSQFCGGGVAFNGNNSTIKNCLIAGNSSTGSYSSRILTSAGGIVLWPSFKGLKVINCTVVNNTGKDVGGVWAQGATSGCKWINTVIWSNKASDTGGIAEFSYPEKPAATNTQEIFNCYSPQTQQMPDKFKALATENVTADGSIPGPSFVNPEAGDFNLASQSVLIDAGDNTMYGKGLTSDLCMTQTKRLQGKKVDVGAYEYSDNSSVDGITADGIQGEKRYYNLNGILVSCDNLRPGIYIERQGDSARKILVK